MYKPACYTSSSIGPCPMLCDNFLQRDVTTSITWDDGFNFNDNSWFKTYHQCDVPEYFPYVVDKLVEVHKFYDLILAWDERVLRECPNAVFLTESACSWIDRRAHGSTSPFLHKFEGEEPRTISPVVPSYIGCDVSAKQFAVSFLTSSKNMFPGHVLRQEIFGKLPENIGNLRVFKHRSPPIISDKRTVLEPYMFSIVPENSKHSGYYSEKLIDCFIANTIPLYWGCTDIAKHFNADGIVQFEDMYELQAKLRLLTPDFYQDRSTVIEENFQTALKGVHQWDLIENAITMGIANKHANPTVETLPINILNRPLRWKRKP